MRPFRLVLCLLGLFAACNRPGKLCEIDQDCSSLAEQCVDRVCKSCESCEGDQTCVRGSCLARTCPDALCKDSEVCFESRCTQASCVNVVCSSSERCSNGKCYPRQCDAGTCVNGEVCAEGSCLHVSCAGVTCGVGEACSLGVCIVQECVNLPCAQGAVCEGSSCVHASCQGVLCPTGSRCVRGNCSPTRCGTTECPAHQVCLNEECVDARCSGLSCSGTQRCHDGACSPCQSPETQCGNGIDDDCDDKKDCQDPDCAALACDDKNVCTSGEKCSGTSCTGGAATVCNSPGSDCLQTTGSCTPGTGCSYPPKAAGASCTSAQCRAVGTCDGSGVCKSPTLLDAGTPCEDGSACTLSDTCDSAGVCQSGTPKPCAAAPDCRTGAGTCDPKSGACDYSLAPAGTGCSDGNACTQVDKCNATGACIGSSVKSCTTSNQCQHPVGSCIPSSGACSFTNRGTSEACEDGNGCTQGDRCNGAGGCTSGGVCPNFNYCMVVSCVAGACQASPTLNGVACNSGHFASRCCNGTCVDTSTNPYHCGGCNTVCPSGQCEPTAAVACDPFAGWMISGRCLCPTGEGVMCPRNQNCRGTAYTYPHRCVPENDNECNKDDWAHPETWQHKQHLDLCPGYCRY